MKSFCGFWQVWLLTILMLSIFTGCGMGDSSTAQTVQKSELVMDTVVQLTAEGAEAPEAVAESFARLKELESMVSNYQEGSDAERLQRSSGSGEWVQLSPEMYHLLEVSQSYSELTEGAWDITAAPLVKLWGIGTDKARVPAEEEIEAARAKVGWQKLELDGRDSARLLEPGMELDLGGIAKGLALDEVRKIYQRHGIENGLINLGSSSIYGVGLSRDKIPWRIGLRNPRSEDPKKYLGVVKLSGEALSTSGDYERYFEAGGLRYHHIIDPRTGYPAWCGAEVTAADRPVSVLVLVQGTDPDCGLKSDLLTTALFVLGRERGVELLYTLGQDIEVLMVTEDGLFHSTPGIEGKVDLRDY